jgi:catechol 2,3-dioxygenase-like lactoylglutathione lyase family enzyme
VISEIRQSTVSVSDLASSRSFYEKVFDYVVHAEGSVSGPAFKALWGLPESMSGEVALMGPRDATSGLVRLVQFDRPGDLYWGDYSGMNNYGHYALNVRVPEIHTTIAAITGNGGRSKSEPTYWTVTPTLSAWDSMSYDPDNILIDVFQLETEPGSLLNDYDGRPTPLQTVAIHSGDACRSARFYAALGFRPMYNKRLENMESFFHTPTGIVLHNINMMMPSEPGIGRLEIAHYVGWPGASQRDRAVPPALGILSASLETDDLDATEDLLSSIGAEPAGEGVETQMPGLGAIAARSYYGPDDELLEFYQAL